MSERIAEKTEENEAAIAEARVRFIRANVPVPGTPVPAECACGEDIPDGRRALGYATCIYCADKPNAR